MIIIQTNTEAEKKLLTLHLEKIRLEGNLEEINRSLGYTPREYYSSRKKRIQLRLDEIESMLERKPMEPISSDKEIEQFFVRIPK